MRRFAAIPAMLACILAGSLAGSAVAAEPARNLNSVPEDGLGNATPKGPDSKLLRQLVNARPNEDLVICVAGCFSGRDLIVYAQPAEKPFPVTVKVTDPDVSSPPAAEGGRPMPLNSGTLPQASAASAPKMTVPPSFDPHAPTILNLGAKAAAAEKGALSGATTDQPVSGGTN